MSIIEINQGQKISKLNKVGFWSVFIREEKKNMLTCEGPGMPSNRSHLGGQPAIEWPLGYQMRKILRFMQYATITDSITFSSKWLSSPQGVKKKSSVPTCGHFPFDGPRVVLTGVTQWSSGHTGISPLGKSGLGRPAWLHSAGLTSGTRASHSCPLLSDQCGFFFPPGKVKPFTSGLC